MKTLYKKAKKHGHVQQWSIEVEGSKFRSTEGIVGGKLTVNEWTECFGKNVGKANETSPEQQGELEAASKIQKKKEKGYFENVDDIEDSKEPTLAHPYEKYSHKIDWNTGALCSAKYDGIRAVITKDGMFSRAGKEILSCPHITDELKGYFAAGGKPVDGELYNHALKQDFEKIVSLVRQTKPTEEDFASSKEMILFYCFDIQSEESFCDRMFVMFGGWHEYAKPEFIKVVPQGYVRSEKEMFDLTETYVDLGYEGSMVRHNIEGGYINGRTQNLLKVKKFQDAEFPVVGILEGRGKRSGTLAKWVVRINEETTCEVNPSGSDESNLAFYKDKENLIGKMITVKFQDYTSKGRLRFANFKAIRKDY